MEDIKEFESAEYAGLSYTEVETANDAYQYFVNLINTNGQLVESRGEMTREVMNAAVLIKNPRAKFITVDSLKLPFIYQEIFDMLNENDARVMHSREMLKKTMGFEKNLWFFGYEHRQGNSRWSLENLKNVLVKDKNSRKAILSYGTRRPKEHYPCMVFSHFIIRDNKLHLNVETRATGITMAWPNDIVLYGTLMETMLGWLKEYYPELEMGTLLFKTISLHYFINEDEKPQWSQEIIPFDYDNSDKFDLNHADWIREMGTLYYYVDEYMKAIRYDDIDNGGITTVDDVKKSLKPKRKNFQTLYFYKWALVSYYSMLERHGYEKNVDYLKLWKDGK